MARWRRNRYRLLKYQIQYRLRRPKIPLPIIIFISLIGLIILSFMIVDRNLRPTIVQISQARAQLIGTEAINKALYEKVLTNVDYNELVQVHKDSQQRITLMQANSIKISRVIAQANLEIKESLSNLEEEVFYIPLGQTLGSKILANYGPKIKVKIVPVGTVDVKLIDEFKHAGINQVRHILYLNVNTTVKIVVPLVTEGVSISNQIPIAETIIVGEVPNTYLGFGNSLLGSILQNREKYNE